ncbi:MAG: GntR family transcriptional regulator [Pseudomonadota bacterium]
MQITWNDKDPIYRQLRDRLKELILEGTYRDGDALPSVRQVASEQRINPITVSRAYQLLVEQNLVEKRRGLGMFVREGATDELLTLEREKFLNEDWPRICERIRRLGLRLETLLDETGDRDHE